MRKLRKGSNTIGTGGFSGVSNRPPSLLHLFAGKKHLLTFKFYKNNKWFLFSAIYFFAWAGYAADMMNFVFYSSSIGFTNTEIGLILASLGLVGIAAQPIFGIICDYIKSTRRLLLISLTLAITLSSILPVAATVSKPAVLCVVVIYTAFMSPFMPLLDNWVARECVGQEKYHFGALRLWGSIGYAIVVFIYGRLALIYDVSFVYYGRALFLAVTFFTVFINRYESILFSRKSGSKTTGKPDVAGLFKKKSYLLFIVFVFIFYFPIAVSSSFFPSLLASKGGSNATLGFFGSINAIVEIPFFLYVNKLTKKIGARGLMLVGGSAIAIRLLGFIFAPNIPLLLAAYFMQIPYTCFFMPGLIFYISSIAPPNTQAFAQTAVQAFSIGVAGMLGNLAGGRIIDLYGLKTMYVCGTVICVVGILFFILTTIIPNKIKEGANGV